jgi:hypothetical protein
LLAAGGEVAEGEPVDVVLPRGFGQGEERILNRVHERHEARRAAGGRDGAPRGRLPDGGSGGRPGSRHPGPRGQAGHTPVAARLGGQEPDRDAGRQGERRRGQRDERTGRCARLAGLASGGTTCHHPHVIHLLDDMLIAIGAWSTTDCS